MTALLNVRKVLGEEISGLGRRLDDSRREVLERLGAETADLRDEGRETRDRVNRGATAAAEAERSVVQLRQELAEVRQSIAGLQQTLDTLAQHPRFRTEPPAHQGESGEKGESGEREEPGWDDPEPVDAGQVTPFPPLASGAEDENAGADEATDADDEDGGGDDGDDQDGVGPAADADDDPGTDGAPVGDTVSVPLGYPPRSHIRRETQEDIDHGVLLLKAAQAGTVVLVCHREAWEFFTACAADNEHYRAAHELADEGDGRVRAVLSGRSVIGALIALRQTRDDRQLDGTWALASAFYSRIAEGLRTTGRGGGRPLTVVFDDGVGGGPD
ncbi:hypothetical protein ACH4FX_29050 [Streptomyces sp. NPDC018019]|uniref:hypothetical protein n=1 Tax=Streptomyces sp. NPDC018019 TaxID=3365030 RepID=UPI0037AF8C31